MERLFDETEASDRVFTGEEIVRGAIGRTVKVFLLVAQLLESAERSGPAIDGTAGFKDGLRDLAHLEEEVEKQWPPLDVGQIRESLNAYRRGDFKSAADLLGELQAGCTRAD